MKKVISYLIIIALLTGVLGTFLNNNTRSEKETDVVCSILAFIGPAVACADTVGDVKPPPPPPFD
ncbi:MAG: hypothetical protein WBB37_00210 [bacterium]